MKTTKGIFLASHQIRFDSCRDMLGSQEKVLVTPAFEAPQAPRNKLGLAKLLLIGGRLFGTMPLT